MWLKQPLHFRIERNGEPVENHPVRHGVNPNITYGRLLPNLVPFYEEQEALRYANYNYGEWRKLPYMEKALHVAHYRYNRLVKLHGEDAVSDKIERESKQATAKIKSRRR